MKRQIIAMKEIALNKSSKGDTYSKGMAEAFQQVLNLIESREREEKEIIDTKHARHAKIITGGDQ